MIRPSSNIEYLRAQDVAKCLGIGVSTWYAWLHTRDDMPKPIKLSSRCVVWSLKDIEAFLEKKRISYSGEENE